MMRLSGLSRVLIVPALFLAGLSGGCELDLLSPMGQVGAEEKRLILTTVGLMLIVVIPVIALTIFFAWRYRASAQARYEPDWSHSTKIEIVVWGIPVLLILIMGVMTWISTHKLDPYRPLDVPGKALSVQVVALDWKWLFIYPEQGIAVVNEMAMPAGRAVDFSVTSDAVMNSFFIPQLGSQIYAMAGMKTKLHLIADHVGVYDGISSNYSGAGFFGMKFKAHAVSLQDFDAWVAKVKRDGRALDPASYAALAKPSQNVPVTYYATVAPGWFETLLNKYRYSSSHHTPSGHSMPEGQMHSDGHDHNAMPAR